MENDPLKMNFSELKKTLDLLLKKADLPDSVSYKAERINYNRYNKIRLLVVGVFKVLAAELFYRRYILRRLGGLKRARFLKTFKPYFYIFRIGLPYFLKCLGGKFNAKIAADYMIAAMLYDASCDIPEHRKYLKEFNDYIMFNRYIQPDDEYLTLFKTSIDSLKSAVDKQTYDTFMDYIKIEHISQLMSIYQSTMRPLTKENLSKITLTKGGITILAGIYLMIPQMTIEKRKALYEVGGVLQIFEDIYDINEDLDIGIQTLSNQHMIGYDEMKQLYFGTVNHAMTICNVDPNRPNITLDIFCWLVDNVLGKKYSPFFKTDNEKKYIS